MSNQSSRFNEYQHCLKALSIGFADYITKPLDVVEFHRILEEQLKSELKSR